MDQQPIVRENNGQFNDVMITPHAGQARVLTTEKRFVLAIAGIQGGKTFIGCIWIQMEIQKNPQGNYLLCGLSKDQVNNVIIDKFFTVFPDYKKFYNKKDGTVYLPTGGKIMFRSLEDPKYTEGITAHAAWIDEADLISYRAYLVVRGRLNATGGRMLMTSSIADNSWIAEYLQRFDPDLFEIITWASNENPAFSNEEWESLKKELDPILFRRRYEADFQFASGRVYAFFDFNKHIIENIPANEQVVKHFIGIDWGYNDPTAIVVIAMTEQRNFYIVDDFSVENPPLDLIVKMIFHFKATYKTHLIYADPSNKLFLKTVQTRVHTTIHPGNRDIFDGTSLVRNLIFQDRFFILKKCVQTQKEMKAYRFKEGLIGRAEEPEDKNNHLMDAIRYPLATYPIPSVRYKKEDPEDPMPDFWLRRTTRYKNELKLNQTLYSQRDEVWMP